MVDVERHGPKVTGLVALEDAEGNKDGDNFFVGGGLAYTPNEDFHTGRLFSYQAGWSFEHYSRDRINGREDSNTGGNEFLLHPTSCIRRDTTFYSSESCLCLCGGISKI